MYPFHTQVSHLNIFKSIGGPTYRTSNNSPIVWLGHLAISEKQYNLFSGWLKAPPKKELDLNNKKYKHYKKKIYRQLKHFTKVIYAVGDPANNSGAVTRIGSLLLVKRLQLGRKC